jgi:2-iminobutanoate/2-iminopropanoate deaminase
MTTCFVNGWSSLAGNLEDSPALIELIAPVCICLIYGVIMTNIVETSTPENTPAPIGPYNHIAKVGQFITIGGTAGVNPATGQLAGPDVYSQAKQILESFRVMLESVDSDLNHIVHVNVFLKTMRDFEEMNRAYVDLLGDHRPARTVIGVAELPKPGVLLTMNLTAVTK